MAFLPAAFNTAQAYWAYVTLTLKRHERVAPWRDQYRYLRAYYWNNGLYDVLRKALTNLGLDPQKTQGLRNPAYRAVEFYASKLWPGPLPRALPIESDNPRLKPAIERIWQMSNWGTEKQAFARLFPMLGDSFIKVNVLRREGEGRSRVFMQNIDPEHVTDFVADERGFLTYIRLDVPQTIIENEVAKHSIRTEIWDKVGWRVYEHQENEGTPENRLGEPVDTGLLADFDIDFVPFVWQPFRAVGDERGANAFINSLDKIDEANRQATRLSEMLFRHNRALWALTANAVDPAGRPLPAPRLSTSDNGDNDRIEVEDDTIFRIPGNGQLTPLVPPINYEQALNVLNAQMDELREDMPELAYYRLREAGVTSGRAARILLDDAYERANEARGMAETALVRAHQMALTLGVNIGLFQDIGTFENGDFDHSFRERPILPADEFEDAQTVQTYVSAGVPVAVAAKRVNWTEEEIDELRQEAEAEAQRNAELSRAMLDQARIRFDQENNGGDGPTPRQGDERLQTGVR